MVVVVRGGPKPNNVYDYTFGEVFGLYRKAIDPEMQVFVKKNLGVGIISLKKQV